MYFFPSLKMPHETIGIDWNIPQTAAIIADNPHKFSDKSID